MEVECGCACLGASAFGGALVAASTIGKGDVDSACRGGGPTMFLRKNALFGDEFGATKINPVARGEFSMREAIFG